MCDWCQKHGAGKKWYLNIKNYSKDLYKDEAVIEAIRAYFKNTHAFSGISSYERYLNLKSDEELASVAADVEHNIGTYMPHRGQVVPLEDVKEIIKIAGPIAEMTCVCRMSRRANFEEKPCILVGPGFLEYCAQWPDYTRGGIDYISREEAVELMGGFNEKGYVATFWRCWESPAVMGFCNCEFPSCGALLNRRRYGDWFNFFLRKAEYVVKQDFDACIGCRICVSRCQFGAIHYSPDWEKAIIDMKKCAGCGLCRDTCPQNAINLVPRQEIPGIRELW